MFGMGMGEIILIAIVALLVVGPERLPAAAKAIGKGIRDLRAQTRDLQQTIEQDTQIGDAVRELRGAMRGDPETLYKRATGEDFLPKDKPEDSASSPDVKDPPAGGKDANAASRDAAKKPADDSAKASVAAAAASDSAASTETEPAALPEASASTSVIADEFANTDDGWGDAAKNPHKGEALDPDLPLIRTPAGAIARGESTTDKDSPIEPDTDSEHG
jgi:sec-independent protein translocase protein TatB